MNKLATLLLILSLSLIPQDLTTLAQNECVIDNCTAATKDKVLDDYLPDVPAMHKLSFLSDAIVSPFAHYVGNDGSEKMTFHGKNLKSLKDLYFKELKNKLNSKYYYADLKDDILNSANDTSYVKLSWGRPLADYVLNYLKDSNLFPSYLWRFWKSILGGFNITKADKDTVNSLLFDNVFLSRLIKEGKDSFVLPLTIDRNSGKFKIPKKLIQIENEIEETLKKMNLIIESNADIESKLDDLDKFIDDEYKKYKNFKEIDSSQKTVAFCFHLNRINDYLLNFENGWERKDLEERKKIHKLREKINFLVPNYCFLKQKQKSPFSNIDVKLDKYNVVEDTKGVKSIYLEKYQIQEYIKDLIKSIDSKYTNLRGDYNFDLVKGENVLKLASEIHATKHQEVLNAMENSLEKSEADIDRKKVNMFVAAGRAALKANFGPDGILTLRPDKENRKFDTIEFTTEEAFNYLAKNRPELLKDSKKLPTRVIEKQPKKEESEETAIQKRSNEQALENYVKINNLGESVLNDLDSLFKDFIDYSVMNAELARNKRTFEAYKNKTKDDISLLDTVKLLIQFSRDDYSSNDLEAIIIEENKKYSTNDASTEKLTEYSIKKIQRMDNK